MKTEARRPIDFFLWIFALCVLVILLTSCSAVIAAPGSVSAIGTPGFQIAPSSPAAHTIATPAPYWQLASLDAWHIARAVIGAKVHQ